MTYAVINDKTVQVRILRTMTNGMVEVDTPKGKREIIREDELLTRDQVETVASGEEGAKAFKEAMEKKKYCKKCEKDKPVSEYGSNKTTSDGLQIYCKNCMSDYAKIRNEKKRVAKENGTKAKTGRWKKCSICKTEYRIGPENFPYKDKGKKRYKSYCHSCNTGARNRGPYKEKEKVATPAPPVIDDTMVKNTILGKIEDMKTRKTELEELILAHTEELETIIEKMERLGNFEELINELF